jgi:hypothetical protein
LIKGAVMDTVMADVMGKLRNEFVETRESVKIEAEKDKGLDETVGL